MTHATHFIRLICIVLALMATNSWADRVKDLASVAAGRSNQLIGYGLVVGLQGTGDGTDVSFTTRTLQNMLSRLGVSSEGPLSDFEPSLTAGRVNLQNIAAVMVTAELPGFAKPGQKIDVNVSAVGKASSLRGGTLLMTPLKGADGQIYALAQGQLIVGGAGAQSGGARTVVNH